MYHELYVLSNVELGEHKPCNFQPSSNLSNIIYDTKGGCKASHWVEETFNMTFGLYLPSQLLGLKFRVCVEIVVGGGGIECVLITVCCVENSFLVSLDQ